VRQKTDVPIDYNNENTLKDKTRSKLAR
jgi:hypothetical protein